MTIRPSRCSGFTLIELAVAVVVVALLAAIAVPSYSAYVTRGQRAAAKVALEQAAQFLERNYTTSGCYQYTNATDCAAAQGTQVSLPSIGAPASGGQYTYAVTVAFPGGPQSFKLAAAPCGTSSAACPNPSNPSFKDPTCGALVLLNTGEQDVDPGGTGTGTLTTMQTNAGLVASCWQR